MGHAASELILLRRVTDVANITYWMRCQGDTMDPSTANKFDTDLRTALEQTLGGAIPDHSWWQAEMSARCGGLGMRSAMAVAPLAFLSSRVCARPMVMDLFATMENRRVCTLKDYMEQYDARTEKCIQAQTGVWGAELTDRIR